MNKKILIILIGIGLIIGIVAILFNNRAKMTARMHKNKLMTFAVSVTKVNKQQLRGSFTQVGTVNASNDVVVTSGVQGRVTGVLVKINDYVEAGTTLVQVYDDLAKVTTPISGIITDLPVSIGMTLNPGTVIANVIDISTLKVKLNVAEDDVFKLRQGDPVTIETDIYPDAKYHGLIESISQKGDDAHTYPVRVSFANSKNYPLKAGMFATVTFHTKDVRYGTVIPRRALVDDDFNNPQVYVIKGKAAQLRDIVLGAEIGTDLVVEQGLSAGDTLVIRGQNKLRDGAQVIIVD